MKCIKLVLFVCAVIGISPAFAGTYLYCYFKNFDTSNLDYVSIYINDDLVSYSTSEYKDLMAKEDRPLSGSGYLLDAYVYPIEDRDASIFIDMCKLYSKSKKARLNAIKVYGPTSKDGFPLVFKGSDDHYHRMEVPSSKENYSLRQYVLENTEQKFQDQAIDLTQTIIAPLSLEQSFFAPSAIESAKKYFNISEDLIVRNGLAGASFLKNYKNGIRFNEQDTMSGISNVMWYITLKGGFYDGFFHDGAFLIDGELKEVLFNLLKDNGHNRPSTHLHKLSNTKLHYEVPFSIGESAGALPGEKRTLLFFQVDQQGFNHLYIKPEDFSLETIYDVIGHSLQTVSSVLRKVLPAHQLTTQLVGNDNALQNRKERVDTNTSFYRNYVQFLSGIDNSTNFIENYRNNGISSIYSHLSNYIKSNNNNSKTSKLARSILRDLTERYGKDLKYRIANEVHVHMDYVSLEKDILKFKKALDLIIESDISSFEIVN